MTARSTRKSTWLSSRRSNPDNDGTVDLKELESPAGQELLKLIYK